MESKKLLLILIFAISCATISKSTLNNLPAVQVNQTTGELTSIIGGPTKKVVKGKQELWFYDLYSSDNARVYPYTAVIEGGRVKSFNADYSRSKETRELCRERKKSNQDLVQVTGYNGAPAVNVDCSE